MSTVNLQLPKSIVDRINTPERVKIAHDAGISALSPKQTSQRADNFVEPPQTYPISIDFSDASQIESNMVEVQNAIITKMVKMTETDWFFVFQANASILFLEFVMKEENRQKTISNLLEEFHLKYMNISPLNYG
jgi:hypothetical protein